MHPQLFPIALWSLLAAVCAYAETTVRVLVPVFYNQDATKPLLDAFFNETGIRVEFISMNSDITEHTATAVQNIFSNKDSYIDLLALDVVWTGDYGEHLLPLDGDAGLASALALHNPQNVAAGLVNGKLVAIPQSAEYGLLYYRTDLLQRYGYTNPPENFDEMEDMMSKIIPQERKTNPAFYGLISQVKEPYEGLTCNVLEYLIAEQAGALLEPNRTLSTFDQLSPIGQRALAVAKRWRPWQSLGYFPLGFAEQSSAREWARGNALFMRNWPFAAVVTRNAQVAWPWQLTTMPGGAATLGGWLWGASRYSRQPEASRRVLELFAGVGWQKAKALSEGMPPTIPALYNDSDVCAAIPMCSVVPQLKVARRPSGAAGVHYAAVSKIIATYWFDILRGFGGTVESLLDRMNREIAALLAIDVLGEPTNIASTSAIVAAFNAIASIEILLLTAALACCIAWRKTPVVANIGLGFMAPVTVGAAMMLVLVYLTAGVPSTTTCMAHYWVHGFGFGLTVGACGIRMFPLWTLASNPFVTQRQTSPRQALLNLVPASIGTLAILIALSASNSIGAYEIQLPKSRYIGCTSPNPLAKATVAAIWYSSYALQLVPTLYFGYKASAAPGASQHEAKLLTLSLANAAFLALVLVPFVDLDLVDQPTAYVLRSLVVTAAVGVFLGVYVAHTVWLAYRYWRDPAQAAARASGMSGAGSEVGGAALNTMHVTQTGGKDPASSVAGAPGVMATATMTTTAAVPAANPAGGPVMMDPVKMVQASQMRRFEFGCQGVLTMRFARNAWAMYFTPWTLVQAYLLPRERVVVVQPFGHRSTVHARCIPLASVERVESVGKDGGNEFDVVLTGRGRVRFMAADAIEAGNWVREVNLVAP